MAQRRGWGGAATLWGLLFGALAVALVLIDRFIFASGRAAERLVRPALAGGFWIRAVLLVVGLLLFFLAGLIAARSTRQIEAGIVGGLLAGLVVGVADLIVTALAIGGVERRIAGQSAGGRLAQVLAAGALGRSIATLVLAALVGAGLGALGGLAGRGRPPVPQAYPYVPPAPPQGNAMPAPRFTPASGYAPDPAQTSAIGYPAPPAPEHYISHPDAPTITPPGGA